MAEAIEAAGIPVGVINIVPGGIAKGRGDGARLVTGGGRPAGQDRGWFVTASGIGRELGPTAISAYQHLKSIYT